jgi:uncharacterized protein YoaH (UPF0181 family)
MTESGSRDMTIWKGAGSAIMLLSVARKALRLFVRADRQEAERINRLQHAWKQGISSGDAGLLDFGDLRTAAKRELTTQRSRRA